MILPWYLWSRPKHQWKRLCLQLQLWFAKTVSKLPNILSNIASADNIGSGYGSSSEGSTGTKQKIKALVAWRWRQQTRYPKLKWNPIAIALRPDPPPTPNHLRHLPQILPNDKSVSRSKHRKILTTSKTTKSNSHQPSSFVMQGSHRLSCDQHCVLCRGTFDSTQCPFNEA